MKLLRVLEAITATLAMLAGLVALGILLFAPSYTGETCQSSSDSPAVTCTTSSTTLLEINGAGVLVALAIFALLLLGIGITGVWHSRRNAPGVQVALWVLTASLTAFTLLAILSIGTFLLPSVVLALVACMCSLGRRQPALA